MQTWKLNSWIEIAFVKDNGPQGREIESFSQEGLGTESRSTAAGSSSGAARGARQARAEELEQMETYRPRRAEEVSLKGVLYSERFSGC